MTAAGAGGRHRTITITGGLPVRVDEALWPVAAEAGYGARAAGAQAKVRRHADGRAICYGVRRHADGRLVRVGRLVDAGGDLVAAVREVAAALGEPALADALLSRLPPVPI